MYEKKANAIIKIYNDMDFSPGEWRIVGFHVYNEARRGILNNILTFHDGLRYYMDSPHFGNPPEQMEFDFGDLTWN